MNAALRARMSGGPKRFGRWLLNPGPSPVVYVLRVWPVAVVPAGLLVLLATGIAAASGHEIAGRWDPKGGFFGIVVFSPLIETLLMVPVLRLLCRWTSRKFAAISVSAGMWAALHFFESPAAAVSAFWGFFILSAAFVAWRARSLAAAFWVTSSLHAVNNLTAWSVLRADELGGNQAAGISLLVLLAVMVASFWMGTALGTRKAVGDPEADGSAE